MRVRIDDDAQTTRVDFVSDDVPLPPYLGPTGLPDRQHRRLSADAGARRQRGRSHRADVVERRGSRHSSASRDGGRTTLSPASPGATRVLAQVPTVLAFRQRAAIFGHNAPARFSLLKADGSPIYPQDWDSGLRNLEGPDDGVRKPGRTGRTPILPRSQRPRSPAQQHRRAAAAHVDRRAVTLLPDPRGVRRVADRLRDQRQDRPGCGSPRFPARRFRTTPPTSRRRSPCATRRCCSCRNRSRSRKSRSATRSSGDTVTLERTFLGLKAGQRVVLTGEREDLDGAVASELRDLKDVTVEGGFTVVRFDRPLDHVYRRQRPRAVTETARMTVTINANVALATHGETVTRSARQRRRQPARSSDSRCGSRRSPTSAPPTPSGGATHARGAGQRRRCGTKCRRSTITGRDERIYVTRFDDDGPHDGDLRRRRERRATADRSGERRRHVPERHRASAGLAATPIG